ncbi:MAG: Multiple antibiotic resistance protein marC [Acidobacteriaceae bacterium]|nr:Multiple antibiotic resistance protein marC [Acidobacteriaceae bacterium]
MSDVSWLAQISNMHESFNSVFQFSLVAFSSIFFLVDPFAAIPTFLAITADSELPRRRRMAKRASWTCFVVLNAFALAGSLIFKFFGITLPAFEIAGGLILLLIGIEMLQARRSSTQEVPREAAEGAEKADAGIVPLGIPMLAGPGAISTVMVLMGPSPTIEHALPVFIAITVTSLLSFVILAGADRVRKHLGQTGIGIMMRMMGLLLTAIAVQFVLNGLNHLGVLPKH